MKKISQVARLSSLIFCSLFVNIAQADDLKLIGGLTLTQTDFKAMSEDMAAAFNYKPVQPTEASGVMGFNIGIVATYTPIENKDAWKRASGEDIGELGLIALHAAKGLPFGIDLGGYYAKVPGTQAEIWGAEVRYSFLEGGPASPAVAIRGAMTGLSGVDDFDFDTRSVDLSISKGFAMLTPYAGVGYVDADSDPKSSFNLQAENIADVKLFAGARFSLGPVNLTAEVDQFGDNTSLNMRLAFGI